MTGRGFDQDVRVRRFPVQVCLDGSVRLVCGQDIQERDPAILLLLPSEFDSRVHAIEAVVEIDGRITTAVVVVVSQSGPNIRA